MSEDPTPYFTSPGDMIRYLRKQKKITIVELATKMGVSQAYISQAERGVIKVTNEQLETLKAFVVESQRQYEI